MNHHEPLGALVLQRGQAGEFPAAVVALMQSFADQSTTRFPLRNTRLVAIERHRGFTQLAVPWRRANRLQLGMESRIEQISGKTEQSRGTGQTRQPIGEKRQFDWSIDNARALASQGDRVVSRPDDDMLRARRVDENTANGLQSTDVEIGPVLGIEVRAPGKDGHRGE
jgi:hypothetical protein